MSAMLEGKVAFVTGAAGGLGREMTCGLLDEGAHVMAADFNEKGLSNLLGRVGELGLGARLTTVMFDVAEYAACARAIETACARFGRLDILINNAALGMGALRDDHMINLVGIEEIPPQVWDRFIKVNLSGAWYLTRAAVPTMRKTGSGRIINVTTSFFTMLRGRFHPYGPAKAALEAMSAGHAQEFEPYGITVNVVVPGGPADTPMVPEVSGFRRADLIPPRVMVPPVVWLCSDEAANVTGNRYIASAWKPEEPVSVNRAAAEQPIGWPGLAQAPVWPGGKPNA
jgi:NAD(P)-dependent dehydrogenase (short-subunit alcohol dehydrogenase family)